MEKPNDYEKIEVLSNMKSLPAGGYVCKIIKLEETKSKTGKDMIKIALDIAEGEQFEYFSKRFRADTRSDKKWSCILYQLTKDNEGNTSRGFKTFVENVKESNEGFEVQWGNAFASCFSGKLIGIIFRREEYVGRDKKAHWITKPYQVRTVQAIRNGEFEVPDDVPIDVSPIPEGFEVIDDDDIPF